MFQLQSFFTIATSVSESVTIAMVARMFGLLPQDNYFKKKV